jgi:predicted metal-dependent hydrolase
MNTLDRKLWNKNTIRLEILADGTLQITAPPHCDISPFLEQKRSWIEKKVQERESIARDHPGGDDLFLFQGRCYRLTQGPGCNILEDTITYTTPSALKQMLVVQLRKEVQEMIDRYTPQLGCQVRSIAIRTQRSRWGSCSGEGTLNLNLATMALPAVLRKYIILHEIVHLRERNHAPGFWKCLGALCPDYQVYRKELKKYWILVKRNTIWQVLLSHN